MDTFEQIKKFLAEGGKCLLIENGKPVGVVLTMEEYELLRSKSQISNLKSQTNEIKSEIKEEASELSKSDFDSERSTGAENPIGEAMVEEINFPTASANIDEINLADADEVTLEDLGLDELPY